MLAHTMKLMPLWWSKGADDSLCDEVVPSSIDNTPLSITNYWHLIRLQMTGDKRLSAASGYYELVEVKDEVPTVYGN